MLMLAAGFEMQVMLHPQSKCILQIITHTIVECVESSIYCDHKVLYLLVPLQ